MTTDAAESLIAKLDAARVQMQAAIEDFDTACEIYPDWTLRHLLAHIVGWEEAAAVALEAHRDSVNPTLRAFRGIDPYNAESVDTRLTLTLEQVRREWIAERARVIRLLRELPAEKFEQEMLMPWGETARPEALIRVLYHHEEEHAADIVKIKTGHTFDTPHGQSSDKVE